MRILKRAGEWGAVTTCSAKREGRVRVSKETKRARDTHSLSSDDGITCQDPKECEKARSTHGLLNEDGAICEDTDRK